MGLFQGPPSGRTIPQRLATQYGLLCDFEGWSRLIAQQSQFIGAAKSNLAYRVIQPLSLTPGLKDRLILVTLKTPDQTGLTLRLIEVRGRQGWYRYLTSVLDPEVLPP